jgi:CheY-like chemotaxis protein
MINKFLMLCYIVAAPEANSLADKTLGHETDCSPASHKGLSTMERMEVLLIEDNAGDAVLIRQILTDASVPINLHIARDGEQAMTMLGDAHFRPDLIILDLNIPRISGAALLDRWKALDVPIVVFSSSLNETERERALALGAREFVRKPIDLEVFTETVSGIIHRYSGPGNATAGGATA